MKVDISPGVQVFFNQTDDTELKSLGSKLRQNSFSPCDLPFLEPHLNTEDILTPLFKERRSKICRPSPSDTKRSLNPTKDRRREFEISNDLLFFVNIISCSAPCFTSGYTAK